MKSNLKDITPSQKEVEIEISAEEFKSFIEESIIELGKDLSVEGFRKGRAPKNIIESKVGREAILMEAAEHAISKNYRKFVLDNNIEVISQPEVEIVKMAEGSPLVFKAKMAVLPVLDLPDYKSIASKVVKNKVSVEEKEIDDTIKWLQKTRAKYTPKDGPAGIGDLVEMEYSSPQINELKTTKTDSFILGQGGFIPGFEEKLVGVKSGGDKLEFSLTIPDNENFGEMRNQKADFVVVVKKVSKTELPEINDEFAKGLGKFNTLEDLKKNIKDGMMLEKEKAESDKVRNEILEKIGESLVADIPEILAQKESEAMLENLKHEASHKFDVPFSDYLKQIKKTEDEVKKSFFEDAKKRVKNFLILKNISEKENITVADQEVEEAVNDALKHYPDIEKAKKEVDLERLREYSRDALRQEKTFKFLEGLAK